MFNDLWERWGKANKKNFYKKKTEKVICPYCDGKGFSEGVYPITNQTIFVKCSKCKGKGFIEVINHEDLPDVL